MYGLREPPVLPRSAGEFPPVSELAEQIREQPEAWIDLTHPASWDLPLLIAHGGIDSIRVVHEQMCRDRIRESETGLKPRDKMRFPGVDGPARWAQEIYFHLLDCGLRVPPTAASLSGLSLPIPSATTGSTCSSTGPSRPKPGGPDCEPDA